MKDNKIKIVHALPGLSVGGAEKVAWNIIRKLDKEKYEVCLMYLKDVPGRAKWIDDLKGGEVRMVPVLRGSENPRFKAPARLWQFLRLIHWFKKERPHIVHTHLCSSDIMVRMAAWAAGVPFIMSTEHNINNTNNIVKLILKRITNKMADKIAAVSGEVAEYSTSVEKADPGKIEVVYNGIDTSKYMNKRGYNNTGKIRIGAMGRLAHQKGFEYLIGALAHLDADFECEIAGDPDPNEDMTEKLKSLIEKSGMKGKVRLVGHREPTDFFRSIDIFVMSSRWEGFPLVLLEAGASGLPVVVPDLGGIREIITDRENGYLFAKGNEKELAERLTEMIKSAKEREVLAKSLYNEVINKFDINDMVARYDEIYERAVKI